MASFSLVLRRLNDIPTTKDAFKKVAGTPATPFPEPKQHRAIEFESKDKYRLSRMPPRRKSKPNSKPHPLPQTEPPTGETGKFEEGPTTDGNERGSAPNMNLLSRIRRLEARKHNFFTQKALAIRRAQANWQGLVEMFNSAEGYEKHKLDPIGLESYVPPAIRKARNLQEVIEQEALFEEMELEFRKSKVGAMLVEKQSLIWEAETGEDKDKRCWEAFEFAKKEGLYIGKEPTTVWEVLDIMVPLFMPESDRENLNSETNESDLRNGTDG
ncbi:hypothetical protein BJ508DRAFT_313534 [Ascobolus immersus RN42]|uniref:Uncharacterized protein n=1 Tax=Ascobolus immersus RN42 TaxID=1160509 RepID=A0A3N4HI84_ASCIM|nr:hypothetical protein BJ508DRAFT_313534 [Ascobolus immersus RN42]